jgi:hypothetical protein
MMQATTDLGASTDVVVWLRSLGLGKYEAAFRENEIDETVLPSLTHEKLKELGVTALGRPYRENELVGRTLQIGERLRLAVLERDPRCKMITIDPETGQTERRVLVHVKKAHDGMAGVYAAVLVEGVVRPGDPIHLI